MAHVHGLLLSLTRMYVGAGLVGHVPTAKGGGWVLVELLYLYGGASVPSRRRRRLVRVA